jgi:hypothetical protein
MSSKLLLAEIVLMLLILEKFLSTYANPIIEVLRPSLSVPFKIFSHSFLLKEVEVNILRLETFLNC